MGNGGAVIREGDTVVRPAGLYDEATITLLRALAVTDLSAPVPVGVSDDGGRVFEWIEGDVGVPPFPAWVMTDQALASAGRLLRCYHQAVTTVELPSGLRWSDEMADPDGGPIICHNDVCPENVVYRRGQAVALLDFDFAAPGRPLWDLAQMARMWSPLRPRDLVVKGMEQLDPFHRLTVLAEAYGLPQSDHAEFVEAIVESWRLADQFLRRRLAAREPAFIRSWEPLGGERALETISAWFTDHRDAMVTALA
jgi:aminoglycoside phosphotransferase (APT) family kinase protein